MSALGTTFPRHTARVLKARISVSYNLQEARLEAPAACMRLDSACMDGTLHVQKGNRGKIIRRSGQRECGYIGHGKEANPTPFTTEKP